MKVLLIEDNEGDLFLIKEMLSKAPGEPFEIETALSLQAGIAEIEKKEKIFDLILLDLRLPDSSGINTFHKIREKSGSTAGKKDIPIVILSGIEDEALALELVKEGAQDYLVKNSITTLILGRAIRYALERHKLQNQITTLRGLIPICSVCKKVRDDQGYWNLVEEYISKQANVKLSHGICPDCFKIMYPEWEPPKNKDKE